MSTLYPAMVNSPITELSAGIDAAATTITVLNGATLPEAPNIATIGQGDLAETIMYASKSGNTLSSITRGFQGTATSWPQNTKIARNFTAYDYDTIRQKLDEGQTIPAPIQRGVNVVNSDQASGATFKVTGCTLCNIIVGGGCESLTTFPIAAGSGTDELSTVQKKSGTSSIKFSTTSSSFRYRVKDYTYPLDKTKYYVAAVWVFIESVSPGVVVEFGLRDINTTIHRYATYANINIVGSWQLLVVKVPTSNTLVGDGFRILFGHTTSGSSGAVSYFDEIRLYEVSAADYAAIGTTITGEAIDRRWPCVDGVQHTQGLSVLMPGKNLLPPFTQWTLFATAQVIEPFRLRLNATAQFQSSFVQFPVKAGQTYTFWISNQQAGAYCFGRDYDSAGNALGGGTLFTSTGSSGNILRTFTTNPNAATLRITFTNEATTGAFDFANAMVVLGDVSNLPASFEPYAPRYAHASIKLASNVDRTIADSYDSATGQVFKRWHNFKLIGATWNFQNDYVGYKAVTSSIFSIPPANTGGYTSDSAVGVKYDGKILKHVPGFGVGADTFIVYAVGHANSGRVTVMIADVDSGWGEDYTPSAAEIKAMVEYGWKMNNGTFGTPYNGSGTKTWTRWDAINNTGSVTTVPTSLANGYPGYIMDYVRATPVMDPLSGDDGGLDVEKGSNTVELLEGVVVREKANPVYSSGYNRWYINFNDGGADPGVPTGSDFSRRARTILAVYDDTTKFERWTLGTNPSGNAFIRIDAANRDPEAEYYVDYIVLDKYAYTANAVDATLTYQSTLGGAVAQATQDISALKQHNGVQDWQLMLDEAYAANLRMDLDSHIVDTTGAHAASSISATGGTTVQEEIDSLKSSVSDGKTVLAAAITDMGQAAAGSETFAGLANKIRDISDDADAAVGNTLVGKTFYQGGTKRTGTMPNRTGNVTGQSVSRSGTTIRIRPGEGYYPGDAGNSVQISDADFVAANIVSGKEIFGLTGSALNAKKFTIEKPAGVTEVTFTPDSGLLVMVFVTYSDATYEYRHNFFLGLITDPCISLRTRIHRTNNTVSQVSASVSSSVFDITVSGLPSEALDVAWWFVVIN